MLKFGAVCQNSALHVNSKAARKTAKRAKQIRRYMLIRRCRGRGTHSSGKCSEEGAAGHRRFPFPPTFITRHEKKWNAVTLLKYSKYDMMQLTWLYSLHLMSHTYYRLYLCGALVFCNRFTWHLASQPMVIYRRSLIFIWRSCFRFPVV